MKSMLSKFMQVLAAAAFAITLFAFIPMTANADNAQQLSDQINRFDPGPGSTGRLEAFSIAGRAIVFVDGIVTGATNTLKLDIDSNLTVIWGAQYSSGAGISGNLVELTGGGSFDIGASRTIGQQEPPAVSLIQKGPSGGSAVESTGAGAKITMYHGTLSNVSGCNTIRMTGDRSIVEIIDGTIDDKESYAIYSTGKDSIINIKGGLINGAESAICVSGDRALCRISGGVVNSERSEAITAYMNVNISGGTIESRDACAINLQNAALSMTGGAVASCNDGKAIRAYGINASINIDGCFILSCGELIAGNDYSGVFGVFNGAPTPAIGGSAVICAWNKPSGGPSACIKGVSNDLTAYGNALVEWNKVGADSGIKYERGANRGFYVMKNVEVKDAEPAVAPALTGPTEMTLEKGYAATATGVYTVSGSPAPAVSKTSGNASIAWDNATNKLSIAVGLEAGIYPVVLTAVNSAGSVSLTFTLTVKAAETSPTPTPAPLVTAPTSNAPSQSASTTTPSQPVSVDAPAQPTSKTASSPAGTGVNAAKGSMANFIQVNTYKPGMFTDVDEDEWYGYNNTKAVARAYEYGLMKGNSADTFNPEGNMTVAEAITVAARVYSIYTTGEENFAKTAPWYQAYVDYAISKEIINVDDFTDYTRTATRAEMAYIFSRSLPASEFAAINTVKSLPDVKSGLNSRTRQPITPYYSEIIRLYESGILAGNDSAGTFNPSANITRAEAAAIISRVILPSTRISGKTFG